MQKILIRTSGVLGPQTGETVRVDGFPGRCRTLHTMSARSTGYIGDMIIEAALSADPADGDWREVHVMSFTHNAQTLGVNIRGKYVWLRCRLSDPNVGEVDMVIVR